MLLPFDLPLAASRRSGFQPDLNPPANPEHGAGFQPDLPRLFILADSISFFYGPYLEPMLAGRFTCDRKGTDLLPRRSGFQPDLNPPANPERRSGFQPDLLQRALALDIESYAVNGGDSACIRDYLRQRPPACDLLLLNCGLHDLRIDPQTGAHQIEPPEYARNLDEILGLAVAIAPQVVWVRSTPVADERHNRLNEGFLRRNDDVIAYNAIADACVAAAGLPSIDLYNFTLSLCTRLEDLDGLILDHVHFTEPVRHLQAAFIAGWLAAAEDPKGFKKPLGSSAGDSNV